MLKVNLGPRWRSSWGTQGFDRRSLRSAAASQGHQARPGGGGGAGGRRRAAPPLPPPFLFQPPPAPPAPRQGPLAGFLDKMAAPVGAQARKLLRDLALRPPLLAARSQVSGPLGGGLEQPLVPFRPLLSSSSWYRVRGRRGATPVERTRGAASAAHEGPQHPLLHVWKGGLGLRG